MGMSNAERQRRYIKRLKARAAEPSSPDAILASLEKLKPSRLPKGFAARVAAEVERMTAAVKRKAKRRKATP